MQNSSQSTEMDDDESPTPNGKSLFFFGAIIRRIRRRWLGYNDPYPPYGYYTCPIYGCNPTPPYRPAPYGPTNYYQPTNSYTGQNPYLTPQQQQQQQQQQGQAQQHSNVIIYQNGPDQPPGYIAYQQTNAPVQGSIPPLPPPPPLQTPATGYPQFVTNNYIPTGPAQVSPAYGVGPVMPGTGPAAAPPLPIRPPNSCPPQFYPCNVGG
ncbi:metacaspase-1-like [Teleopsis dalmanni]|uniref:metacaspase-1-like n=1 Tax=Teleopsis dalmanni TaxID=139649 RepID=UPI0018CDA2F2|nr:metacaspase-1-like [Teleopsis dalmanni]